MRLLCLGCDVLARPLYLCAARSPHIVDLQLFERGLHNTPSELRARLQERIDWAASQKYDAVVLGYGLCGQAVAGLSANRVPLVVPRAHDCITLFLGGRDRYRHQFDNFPGTYWYVLDYIERGDTKTSLALGSGTDTDLQAVYEEYVQKYGQDNADYLMEVMGAWQGHYKRAALIDMGVGDPTAVEEKAQGDAQRRGWVFDRLQGDLVLIRRLIEGDWKDDFLVLQPGEKITMTYDEQVVNCTR